MHKDALYKDFIAKGGILTVKDGSIPSVETSSGYSVEVLQETRPVESSKECLYYPVDTTISASQKHVELDEITSLIVTVKATATVSALRPLRRRLNSNSTIVLLQNGVGQIDELNHDLFPDIQQRPTYIQGILVHGIHLESPFSAICAYKGHCKLAVVNQAQDLGNEALRSRSITTTLQPLLNSKGLCCHRVESEELLQLQLNKLAANCVINPITALLDVQNGSILNTPDIQQLLNSIIEEISNVLSFLPEVRNLNLAYQFTTERLQAGLAEVVTKTSQNSSSMREDVRKGRQTEDRLLEWLHRNVDKKLG